ncbi:MAG: hypothetical protein V3R98_06375 [Alphaproteobacteria bacterium]
MTAAPSRAVRLFGTDEPVTSARTLTAGPLSAELDAGNLRYIRLGGTELLRAVSVIVRDRNWGTYSPEIETLKVDEGADGFTVSYVATCRDDEQELRYTASIAGASDGTLRFAAEGEAITHFVTNRTGFTILHGVEGISGAQVEVLHVDGGVERSTFPSLIEPAQPFKDIRALTHEALPGVRVVCTMEGDAFEMEDQRNWSDASYKTYVRPLALPWPYTIHAGERFSQSVTLSVEGALPAAAAAMVAVRVTIGGAAGTMPWVGLGIDPQHAAAAFEVADLIRRAGPQSLVCHFDPRAGHGAAAMAAFKALGAATGAELVLEAVVPCVEARDGAVVPTASDAIMKADIATIAAAAAEAGAAFSAVTVSPAADLKSTQPDGDWPATPPPEDLYAAARAAFPGAAVGGGTLSYFTELNRKRPPAGALDFVTHTTCPIIHACDDGSVMESLESLPSIVRSTAAFVGDTPYRVGPSAIGMRANPYGASYMANPENRRVAMARMDPRQRGLLGAAWTLGYAAHMARGGVAAVALSAPVGEFGIVHVRLAYRQPWFDDAGGVYPVYHVIAGMAAAADATMLETTSSAGRDVQCVACRTAAGVTLWLANLVGEPREVDLAGLSGPGRLCLMDEDSFQRCVAGADGFDATAQDIAIGRIALKPYAVARIDGARSAP